MGDGDLKNLQKAKNRVENGQYGSEVLDELELLTKFVMEPNLDKYGFDREKFKHNNKTWFTTNTNAGDAMELRRLSENIQLLNTFDEQKVEEVEVKDPETGRTFTVERSYYDNRFDDLKHVFMDNITAINSSSAGKYSSVLKLMRSIIHKQDQTVEDKSAGKSGGFFSRLMGGNKSNR